MSFSPPKRYELVMVLLVAAFAVAAACWSDRIPISGGLGWDGAFYGRVAADPLAAVRDNYVDAYGVQRVLPAVLVHVALRALRLQATATHIIAAFLVLNAVLLTLAAAIWVAIARTLKLAPTMAWLGWLALFVNFANMRQASYYPVLTDVSAFVVGLAMLLCFLRRRNIALAALTLVGAFIWPVASAVGLLLLAVPPTPLPERDSPGALAVMAAVWASLATCVLASYLYFIKRLEWLPGMPSTIVVSIVVVTAFVAIVSFTLLRGTRFSDLRMIVRAVALRDLALAGAVIVATQLVQRAIVDSAGGGFLRRLLRSLGMLAVAKPFNFYVPHVIYFGPIICVMVVMWPTITRVAREWGIGVVGVMLLTIGLGLNSESRQAMLGYPLLVAVTVVAVSRRPWPASGNWWVAALGLLASKVWMPMPLVEGPTTDATIAQYPMQWYFMNHGPWISVANFLVQGAIVAVVTAAAWWLLRRSTYAPARGERDMAAPAMTAREG